MKKIIFILVILAVLLFSGCDAMLEVFYPEFADDYNDTNKISDISYSLSPFHYGVLVGSGEPLQLKLVSNNGAVGDAAILPPINFYGQNGWWTYFFDTTVNYDAYFWCDVDGSSTLNSGDLYSTNPMNIDFTDGSSYKPFELGPIEFTTF